MTGVPGESVQGSYHWSAPDTGDRLELVYSAGEQGYVAEADHLPVSPAVPVAPKMVMPVMVEHTPEVVEAREAFMKYFQEAKMRAEEANMKQVEANAVEAVERRRRAADAQVYGYAPAYPHYYVYPALTQKVVAEEAEMKEDEVEMVDMKDAEEMDEGVVDKMTYSPLYPGYYPLSVYPTVQQTVVRTPQYYYPSMFINPTNRLYPVVAGNTLVYPPVQSLVSQVQGVQLPESKLQGEDEAAALAL